MPPHALVSSTNKQQPRGLPESGWFWEVDQSPFSPCASQGAKAFSSDLRVTEFPLQLSVSPLNKWDCSVNSLVEATPGTLAPDQDGPRQVLLGSALLLLQFAWVRGTSMPTTEEQFGAAPATFAGTNPSWGNCADIKDLDCRCFGWHKGNVLPLLLSLSTSEVTAAPPWPPAAASMLHIWPPNH